MRADSPTTSRNFQSLPRVTLGREAVVIGGSVAGLSIARVLSDFFDNVTVCERDRFSEHAEHRPGVPQSRHLHVLLARGLEVAEDFFPGLRADLLASCAAEITLGRESAWYTRAGWLARFADGPRILSFSRPLIDWHLRERVRKIPNVRIVDGCEVLGLTATNGRVTGVRARLRSGIAAREDEFVLGAELVVEASGRRSCAANWLEMLGYDAPEESLLTSFLGYASCVFRPPKGFSSEWKALMISAAPPERTRGGMLFEIEGGRWMVTLAGGARDYPPTDMAGFMEFARSLPSPLLADALHEAEPLTPIVGFRATENRRRHYERLRRMPDRFAVAGDAACAFNPVYGQGMSTALLGTLEIRECLERRALRNEGIDGLAREIQRRLAKVADAPWMLATGEDYRYPHVEGAPAGPRVRIMRGYVDRVLARASKDPAVSRLWTDVVMMLDRPTALFRPWVVARALASGRPRPQPARARRLVIRSHDPVESA